MIVVLFGVSGAGKTLVGRLLAAELDWPFHDADDFHPPANVEKMRRGVPLTDEDRHPWLERLAELIRHASTRGESAVLACSALRESYRQTLNVTDEVRFVHLKGDYTLIESRLKQRRDHFMNADLLRSQFDTLEEPRSGALVVNVNASPEEIVREIKRGLKFQT